MDMLCVGISDPLQRVGILAAKQRPWLTDTLDQRLCGDDRIVRICISQANCTAAILEVLAMRKSLDGGRLLGMATDW